MQQGKSEPEFYGDLDYKSKRIVGKLTLTDQFKNIISECACFIKFIKRLVEKK